MVNFSTNISFIHCNLKYAINVYSCVKPLKMWLKHRLKICMKLSVSVDYEYHSETCI